MLLWTQIFAECSNCAVPLNLLDMIAETTCKWKEAEHMPQPFCRLCLCARICLCRHAYLHSNVLMGAGPEFVWTIVHCLDRFLSSSTYCMETVFVTRLALSLSWGKGKGGVPTLWCLLDKDVPCNLACPVLYIQTVYSVQRKYTYDDYHLLGNDTSNLTKYTYLKRHQPFYHNLVLITAGKTDFAVVVYGCETWLLDVRK
jgi:hypothetical protein